MKIARHYVDLACASLQTTARNVAKMTRREACGSIPINREGMSWASSPTAT